MCCFFSQMVAHVFLVGKERNVMKVGISDPKKKLKEELKENFF